MQEVKAVLETMKGTSSQIQAELTKVHGTYFGNTHSTSGIGSLARAEVSLANKDALTGSRELESGLREVGRVLGLNDTTDSLVAVLAYGQVGARPSKLVDVVDKSLPRTLDGAIATYRTLLRTLSGLTSIERDKDNMDDAAYQNRLVELVPGVKRTLAAE